MLFVVPLYHFLLHWYDCHLFIKDDLTWQRNLCNKRGFLFSWASVTPITSYKA